MLTEGAWGATRALMGNEISDMLRRLSACACLGAALIDSGRGERVDVVFDVARCSDVGGPVRLGHESVGYRWREVGLEVLECEGLPEGDTVERRARLRSL